MSGRGRGAVLPDQGWVPRQRLTVTAEVCTVLFIEESGSLSKVFDFTTIPVGVELQRWLAAAFARATGPRSGVKRMATANSYFRWARRFASVLAAAQPVPLRPQEITGAHMAAYRLTLTPAGFRDGMIKMRKLVRGDGVVPQEAQRALCAGRLAPRQLPPMPAYTESERQQILTAARGEVRRARDRILAAREVLECFRRGELEEGSARWEVGEALDALDRTGNVPRMPCGQVPPRVLRAGGMRGLLPMLCLNRYEAAAFAVLLVDLTGENFGTLAEWPALHFRPDGGQGEAKVALVEGCKPRRGPSREHMVTAIEDLPAGLAALVEGEIEEERRLFRSPLRLYQLLLDLTALARKHGGLSGAFCYVSGTGGEGIWRSNMTSGHVGEWAVRRGFPRAPKGVMQAEAAAAARERGRPSVNVLRLRQTALERRRRPVAHAASTLRDYYLRRSPQVLEDSRRVVRQALDAEVAKARKAMEIPVFPRHLTDRAVHEPDAVAAEMGVDTATLPHILAGEQDTVLAACVDHHQGPLSPPGQACDLSFLYCLRCPNARALPHHLPAQLAAHDHLTALRTDLDVHEWQARYAETAARLTDLLNHYSAPERDAARHRIGQVERARVAALIAGELDLR
ncbi:hypothetical protein ACH4SK_38475 [Streptomyces inhibens]|uniref:hypothetical protein n=1 Tax=Streptomyces inhibens TaxID=2293571 RepID=UPI00379611E2